MAVVGAVARAVREPQDRTARRVGYWAGGMAGRVAVDDARGAEAMEPVGQSSHPAVRESREPGRPGKCQLAGERPGEGHRTSLVLCGHRGRLPHTPWVTEALTGRSWQIC